MCAAITALCARAKKADLYGNCDNLACKTQADQPVYDETGQAGVETFRLSDRADGKACPMRVNSTSWTGRSRIMIALQGKWHHKAFSALMRRTERNWNIPGQQLFLAQRAGVFEHLEIRQVAQRVEPEIQQKLFVI
jgi:hypothetical protein